MPDLQLALLKNGQPAELLYELHIIIIIIISCTVYDVRSVTRLKLLLFVIYMSDQWQTRSLILNTSTYGSLKLMKILENKIM